MHNNTFTDCQFVRGTPLFFKYVKTLVTFLLNHSKLILLRFVSFLFRFFCRICANNTSMDCSTFCLSSFHTRLKRCTENKSTHLSVNVCVCVWSRSIPHPACIRSLPPVPPPARTLPSSPSPKPSLRSPAWWRRTTWPHLRRHRSFEWCRPSPPQARPRLWSHTSPRWSVPGPPRAVSRPTRRFRKRPRPRSAPGRRWGRRTATLHGSGHSESRMSR